MSEVTRAFTNVGGAWTKTDRNGNPFLSLKLELPDGTETTLLLFPNRYKLNSLDGRPDYICYQPAAAPETEPEAHPF